MASTGARAAPGNGRHEIFVTLDGMRFVAAILVLTRHVPLFGAIDFPASYLAVDLFFVLSGFVVANAYEEQLLSKLSNFQFILLRAIRLYPLYLLGIVIGLATVILRNDYDGQLPLWVSFVMSLFFIPNGKSIFFPLNGPAWSLFLEMAINITYCLLLNKIVGKYLVIVIAAAGLALIVFVLSRIGVHSDKEVLNYGFSLGSFPVGIARVTFSFYVGVALYRLYHTSLADRWTFRTGSAGAWSLIACVTALLAMQTPAWASPFMALISVLFAFPALVLAGAFFRPQGVSAMVFRAGGLTSYAIYVLHFPIARMIEPFVRAIAGIDLMRHVPEAGFVFIAILILFCYAVDRYYDVPIRRRLTYWKKNSVQA